MSNKHVHPLFQDLFDTFEEVWGQKKTPTAREIAEESGVPINELRIDEEDLC